jgi:hypothetical protein
VRRSPRLQINNKGFKPGTCADRRCLAFSLAPPDLLPSQIKKLGLELYSIDENLLSEQALHQKKTCKSVSTPKERTEQNEDGKLKKKQQLKENKVLEEEEPSSERQEENGASQAVAAPKKSKK